MTVNGVNRGYLGEEIKKTYNKQGKKGNSFNESFADFIENMEENNEGREGYIKVNSKDSDIKKIYDAVSMSAVSYTPGRTNSAVTECEVRGILYEESDTVKVSIKDRCIYKIQVDAEANKVYIEEKKEDGTVKGYEVLISEVCQTGSNQYERIAYEAWEMYHMENNRSNDSTTNEMSYKEALLKFYDFVEDRIENGPPKIQIGASALSEEDWKILIQKLDEDIDEIKKEIRERVEKEKQKENQHEVSREEDLIQKILY